MGKPLILVTNDDGIYSEGIYVLERAMSKLGRTVVFAPESERSAVGHAITLADPIHLKMIKRRGNFLGYAVSGTPADCVKLGVKAILEETPSLVVSGVNKGLNVGMSVLYSGTVSAATEGVILGIPAIAISLDTHSEGHFSVAAKYAVMFAKQILEKGITPAISLNINVPNLPDEKIKGCLLTRQGNSYFREDFVRRIDPRKRTYYWMDGQMVSSERHLENDDVAVREGYVSVTPLTYDLTSNAGLERLKKWKVFKR